MSNALQRPGDLQAFVGVGETTSGRIAFGLAPSLVSRNSVLHQLDAAQSGEISTTTTSQRATAARNAFCQWSPGARPSSGSRSRKTSSQPCAFSQSRTAMASALLRLE